MIEQFYKICMQSKHFHLPIKGFICELQFTKIDKLFSNLCFCCGCDLSKMSVPQGAFMAIKIQQNEKKTDDRDNYYYKNDDNMELNPLQYNSKMMNSIWGLYNRYSVHNLKKNIDKTLSFNTMNQQIQTVGSTAGSTVGTTSAPVFTSPWEKLAASFGNPY